MRDFIDFRHFVQLKWCNSILRFFQDADLWFPDHILAESWIMGIGARMAPYMVDSATAT